MLAERLTAQLLSGPPARDPLAVAERLLAIQGQDGRAARLAIRARSRGLTVADVDAALAEGSMLITWLHRGTLHLVRSEDYFWLHALTTPQLVTANARRLEQEGVSPADAERAVKVVVKAIGADGPQTRDQLRERVDAAGVPTARQALIHILLLASLRGLVVRGPMIGKDHAYVLVEDWLGAVPTIDRDAALAELARRYLIGHWSGTDRDLAKWAGVTLGDARAGLSTIASELRQGDDGLVALRKSRRAAAWGPPRLLGPWDELLMGWVSREDVLGDEQGVVTVNGIFKSIAVVEGRAVATWTMPRGEVELAPFGRLSPSVREALAEDALDVKRFLAG